MFSSFKSMNILNYDLHISPQLLPYYLPNSLSIEDIQEDEEIEEIEKYLTPDEILKIIDKLEIDLSGNDDPEVKS